MSSGFPTANFSDSEEGLFSPPEIKRLMRIEYDRAQRYSYPMVLMLVEVDRLEYLHDLYGYDSKEEILHAVIGQLRGLTRESDFLGCMENERVLAAFPHTPERAAGHIAGRLLQGSRSLLFESGGRRIRVTLSIGISVSDPERLISFEDFNAEAHDALQFAVRSGGDRYVRREPATHLIESLREELEEEARSLREEQESEGAGVEAVTESETPDLSESDPQSVDPSPSGAAARQGSLEGEGSSPFTIVPARDPALAPGLQGQVDEQDDEAATHVRALFSSLSSRPQEVMHLERDMLNLVRGLLANARSSASGQAEDSHRGHVDRLERRIEKLKDLLDQTEANLHQMALQKEVDPGVASIYSSVQGLPTQEQGYARKKEMLTILFEANVNLRRDIREQKQDKPHDG